jgi:hypothetical protein
LTSEQILERIDEVIRNYPGHNTFWKEFSQILK